MLSRFRHFPSRISLGRALFSNKLTEIESEEKTRPSYFDQPVKRFNRLQLIPHFLVGASFIVFGKFHLLIIPMVSIPVHYYLVMGGILDGINAFNLDKASHLSLDIEETNAFQ